MKLKTLIATFVFAASFTFAQDFSVNFDVKLSSSSPEVKAQLGMLEGSTFKIISSGDKSRTEMSMGAGLMVTTTIMDAGKNKGIMLMEGMMGKQATILESLNDDAEAALELDIELIDEVKTIQGYECKKAIVYGEDDVEMIYWYTDKIQPKDGAMGQYVKNGIPGLPLEFTLQQPQITMHFTATEVSDKLGKTKGLFNLSIPKGYKEVSMDEVRSLGGM